jgi:hypothetical protein
MFGWMDGWMGGCTDRWTDRQTDRQIGKWMFFAVKTEVGCCCVCTILHGVAIQQSVSSNVTPCKISYTVP